MDIFTYTSYNKPEETLQIVRQYSKMRVRDASELPDLLRAIYKNLRIEDKEDFLLKLSEIHPDRDLLVGSSETIESDMSDNECHCNHCMARRNNEVMHSEVIGSMVGANGMNAVGHYMNSGAVPTELQSNGANNEISALKNENMMRTMFNDRVFKIMVIGAIGFLIWKIVKK